MDIEFSKQTYKPGPGAYEGDKANSIPSMKFGSGQRGGMYGTKDQLSRPPPDAYNTDATRIQTAAPKYGFGSQKRTSESKLALSVPGPGNYMHRTFTGAEGSKFSMGLNLQYEPHKKE